MWVGQKQSGREKTQKKLKDLLKYVKGGREQSQRISELQYLACSKYHVMVYVMVCCEG